MPIFEFSCDACGAEFEELLRQPDPPGKVHCPSCGSSQVRRRLSAFAVHGGKPIKDYKDFGSSSS